MSSVQQQNENNVCRICGATWYCVFYRYTCGCFAQKCHQRDYPKNYNQILGHFIALIFIGLICILPGTLLWNEYRNDHSCDYFQNQIARITDIYIDSQTTHKCSSDLQAQQCYFAYASLFQI